jgi:hypothetical protein
MCLSTDLLKQDGVFVCQSCGCKYTVEEARKMMVEGVVDVSGSTVKVDTSDELANLYQIARRAKDDNNGENAAKYYDMILIKDPTSWEAAFYVVYFKAMECKIAYIKSAAVSVHNCLDSVLTLIRDHVKTESEKNAAVAEVVTRCVMIANMLYNGAKNHYDGIDSEIRHNYKQELVDNCCASRDILYNCGTQIDRIFGDVPEIGALAVVSWKAGMGMHEKLLGYFADKSLNKRIILSYAEKIGQYDSEYSRNYIYTEKKQVLENEISSLRGQLAVARNEKPVSKVGILFAGIGIFALGVLFCAISDGDGLIITCGVVELVIGLGFFIAGCASKSKNEKVADRDRRIMSLSAQLREKEAELNRLTK